MFSFPIKIGNNFYYFMINQQVVDSEDYEKRHIYTHEKYK